MSLNVAKVSKKRIKKLNYGIGWVDQLIFICIFKKCGTQRKLLNAILFTLKKKIIIISTLMT